MFEKLSDSLKGTLKKIASAVFVDDSLIDEVVRELQRSLLQADVNVGLVLELSKHIKERAKSEPEKGLTKREQLIRIVHDELVQLLGGGKSEIILGSEKPSFVMLVGLFGSGKTTTCGKLARYFSKRGLRVALLGLDVYRPAAMAQLEQLSKQLEIPVFIENHIKDPVKIFNLFKEKFSSFDVVLVDTAGRDALNADLIDEIKRVSIAIHPSETLLVISADIGQTAQSQAEAFHSACKITGVFVTKMDGTAKAGGALTACSVAGVPVKFVGVGEKVEDIESFNPTGFVGRMLGMGDLEALLEKTSAIINQEDAEQLQNRFLKGEFTLLDLYQQMDALSKMGPLAKVMEMIPGLSSAQLPKEALSVQEGKLKLWKHSMNSMTKKELEDPEILSGERIARISKGSGTSESNIRELLKQYRQAKKLAKIFKGVEVDNADPNTLLKKLQKGKIKLR